MPEASVIGDDTLLRLGVAAALEFPDGSMSAAGLRREAQHGRLKVWRIAGKDYTTKQALKEMRGNASYPATKTQVAARPKRPKGHVGHQRPRARNQHRLRPR